MKTLLQLGRLAPAVATLIFLAACASDPAHKRLSSSEQKICAGMLEPKLNQDDFMSAWGAPDRTGGVAGDDYSMSDVRIWNGIGRGSTFQGHQNYVVWTYDQKDLTLAFNKDQELVSWRTSKTVKELAARQPNSPAICEHASALP